jgi:hypothetical protein
LHIIFDRAPVAWLAILAVISSVLIGIPSSAVASPGPDTTEVDESPVVGSDVALSSFLEKLSSSGRSKIVSRADDGSKDVQVNLGAILSRLPESANFSATHKQELVAKLASQGVSVGSEPGPTSRLRSTSVSSSQTQRGRIINGLTTSISDAPWQVGLVYSSAYPWSTGSDYQNFFCGGSIIGLRWILTAAHCVQYLAPKDLSVVFGISTLPDGLVPRANKASVSRIIVHPAYEADSDYDFSNDVALIELSANLRLSSSVAAIRMATPSLDIPEGGDLFVSGWGATSVDSEGYQVYPRQLQSGTTSSIDCPQGSIYGSNEEALICAGSEAGDQVDACYGDSGGPLVYSKNDPTQRALVGVVSFGPDCPPAGIGAYADVAHFSSWVMCHSSVAFPFGGPHFCGDESGFVTVADTLKVGLGLWGSGSRQSIQWSQDGVPIRGADKTTLSMKGLFGKVISVRITAGSLSSSNVYNGGEPVGEALQFDFYPSGDFLPCSAVNYAPPNKGKCVGTKGNWNGELLSDSGKQLVGFDDNDEAIELEYGYWAYKDFTLPKNTVGWTWGLFNPWAPGAVISESHDYGADYFGVTTSRTPLVYNSWDLDTFWVFSRSQYPLGYNASGEPDYEIDPVGGPISVGEFIEWSDLMVNGKGRAMIGTFGDDGLGSRFAFEEIMVVSIYR